MKKTTWLSTLLYHITAHLRCRIITGNRGEPYLERYHLFRLPGGGGVYIHRFVDSDPDRGLHDHPWKAATSLILSGSYRELRLQDNSVTDRILRSGRLNRLAGEDFHRIILIDKKPVWTLFAHTGKYKDWGFITWNGKGESTYIPHEQASNEQDHKDWWKTAPRGKNASRLQKTTTFSG